MTTPMALDTPAAAVPRELRAEAGCVLVLAVLALRLLPWRHTLALTRRLADRARRPATMVEAVPLVAAVQCVAGWYPGRAACLETSIAAAWLAGLRGTPLAWCHGVRTHPYAFHAWVSVEDEPVAEPATTRAYHELLRIEPRLRTNGDRS